LHRNKFWFDEKDVFCGLMAIPRGNEFVTGIVCTNLTIYFPTKSLTVP